MPTSHSNDNALARRSNPTGTLTDVKLGHIVAALGRYRPVLAVIGVILLLAVVLEGPNVIGETGGFAASNRSSTVQSGAAATTTTTAPPAPPDAFAPPAPLGGAGTTAAGSSDRGSAGTTPAFTYKPPASTAGDGDRKSSGSGTGTTDSPLTIAAAAWASQAGGTPVAEAGVPDDSLPVGRRLGQDDKRSFVRLTGDDTTLTLVPVDGEDGHRSPEEAVIRACQITEAGWEEGEAMPFDDAPPYDAEDCVDGVRAENGTWTFSLLLYPQRADGRGFALVPGDDAPLDFQVAFTRG